MEDKSLHSCCTIDLGLPQSLILFLSIRESREIFGSSVSMATNTNMDGEFVTLRCIEDDFEDGAEDVISISTAEINSWDLTSILTHRIVHIKANRNRIIQMSSYFSGLLSGSFSESCLDLVSIHWNAQSFLSVLRFMFGYYVEITSDNFILLYEAALFFGVESLLSQCQLWLSEVTSSKDPLTPRLHVDALSHVWKYGVEHDENGICCSKSFDSTTLYELPSEEL